MDEKEKLETEQKKSASTVLKKTLKGAKSWKGGKYVTSKTNNKEHKKLFGRARPLYKELKGT